jgi:hypothetical protein
VIWVVGEERGRSDGQPGPGDSSARLASLCGVTQEQFLKAVAWINLFDHPGTDPVRYVRMVEKAAEPFDAIVMLGKRVQAAFLLDHLNPLESVERNGGIGPMLLALPHPSGRNRWYNDPDHVADASIVMRRVWGSRSR